MTQTGQDIVRTAPARVDAIRPPIIEQTAGDLGANARSFWRSLRASNLSSRTIKTYIEGLNTFARFLRQKGMPTDVANIRREHLEDFINELLTTRSAATALNRFASLRAFWKWLVEEGEIRAEANPFKRGMRPPKVGEQVTPILTEEQMRALLKACSGPTFEDRRDMALLTVYLTTGGRRTEIATLRYTPEDPLTNDIDLDIGQCRILGKGGRERLVPLVPKCVKAIDRYLRVRAKHPAAGSQWLWLGRHGRLTPDGIRQMLDRRANMAGLPHIHLHQLRHSFAHFFLADAGQESDLMRLAGWRSRTMLNRYAASAAQERALAAGRKFGIGSRI